MSTITPITSRTQPPLRFRPKHAPFNTNRHDTQVGRLHMWLGKALFLKGEDRRGQALEEYREGVRVLEQSNADRGSPSMALFHWYLGEALLEVGEVQIFLRYGQGGRGQRNLRIWMGELPGRQNAVNFVIVYTFYFGRTPALIQLMTTYRHRRL